MQQTIALHKVLAPEDFLVLVDTRERVPWNLSPLRVETATLATGDYSIKGLEDLVAVERKSMADLAACCGRGRERFEKELQRLLAYRSRAVVVEASWADMRVGGWPGLVPPKAVLASIASWTARGVPFVLAGDRDGATDFARHFLTACARHEHRRLRAFAETLRAAADQGRGSIT